MTCDNGALDTIIRILNEALEADPEAINALFTNRVPCNEKLADHPTIIVNEGDDGNRIGPLGLINGFVGLVTGQHIVAIYDLDADDKLIGFEKYKFGHKDNENEDDEYPDHEPTAVLPDEEPEKKLSDDEVPYRLRVPFDKT